MEVGNRYLFHLENGGNIEGTILFIENTDEIGNPIAQSKDAFKKFVFDDVKIRKDIAPSLADSNPAPGLVFSYQNFHKRPGMNGLNTKKGSYFIQWGDETMDLKQPPTLINTLGRGPKGWRIGGRSRRQRQKRTRRRRSSRR